ncbi:30S ribosomal protein S17 [Patescibacteria group bacterium]|nr:30S ribosomal protein S17 [Patescibacteria group bacterium]
MSEDKAKKIIRKFQGIVVSDKMNKTISVRVERTKIHSKYAKRYKVHKNYLVDDPKEQYKTGDKVSFSECRPLSKNKRWRVEYINRKEDEITDKNE